MVEFWVVAGAGGSRKSSTIRSLTGSYYQADAWEVELNGHLAKMFVQSASPQERKPFQCPQDVVDRVKEENVQHVLIALRHTATAPSSSMCKGSPVNAIDYVKYFELTAGWIPKGILITSPEPAGAPLARDYPHLVAYAPVRPKSPAPSNAIANVVRSSWGF